MAARILHSGPVAGDTVIVGDDHHTINQITGTGDAHTHVHMSGEAPRKGYISRDALRDAWRTRYGRDTWEIKNQSS